jgi:ABC-type Fe3+/spermidine/putrescine transport system ATPase subunit
MAEVQRWLVDLFGIADLLPRKPRTLSGGERQKVALARALSTRPEVLLLDEPLSALDPETRESVQEELRKLHSMLKSTIVHVTHDFEEAMALGNRIAVIGEGRLRQIGTPEQIFRHPESEFVARFTMMRNLFAGTLRPLDGGKAVFQTEGIEFQVSTYREGTGHAGVRPDDIVISLGSPVRDGISTFSGTITRIVNRGLNSYVTVRVPPEFCCLVNQRQIEEMNLKDGKQVFIAFRPDATHVF